MENKLNNYYLAIGVMLLIIPIVLYFFNTDVSLTSYELGLATETYPSVFRYWLYIIIGCTIVPIYEELFFTGVFAKSKWVRYSAIVGLIVISGFWWDAPINLIFIALFFLSYAVYFRTRLKNSSFFLPVVIFFNCLMFATVHIDFQELDQLWVYGLSMRFGGHLISVWLLFKYRNLLYCILFHALWNLSVSAVSYSKEENNGTIQKPTYIIENNDFKIEYSETHLISLKSMNFNDNEWNCKSCLFEEILEIQGIKSIKQKESQFIFDINIDIKNDSLVGNDSLANKRLTDLLIEEEMIVRTD